MNIDLILVYYNNEKSIPFVIDSVKEVSSLFSKIILVNNGSTDNTKVMLYENFHNMNKYQIVDIKKNIHLGGAIKAGILKSKSRSVGWSHGDLIIHKNDYQKFVSKIRQLKKENAPALIKGIRVNRKDYLDKFFALCSGIYASILFRRFIYDISGIPVFYVNLKNRNLFADAPNDYTFHFFIYYFCIHNKIDIHRVDTSLIIPPISQSSWSRNMSGYIKIISIWLKSFKLIKNNLNLLRNEKTKK
jgi:glycosyltransferase involved in cell wall biosynthesis